MIVNRLLKNVARMARCKAHGVLRPRKRAKRVSAKAKLQVVPKLHIQSIGEDAQTKF